MERTKKKMLFSIGLYFAALLILYIPKFILPESVTSDPLLADTIMTILRLICVVLIFVLLKKQFQDTIGFKKEGTVKTVFWYGLAALLLAVFQLLTGQPETLDKSFGQALPMVLFQLVCNMTVGLYEEVIFRGTLFDSFREHFGDTKKGIFQAVLFSSLLFGATHLLNLIGRPYLIVGTASQVIYSIFFGTLFCALYYRCKNLLPCVILHGLIDFCSAFWGCFTTKAQEAAETDTDIVSAIVMIVITLPLLICGILQFRKMLKQRNTESAANA